MSTLLDEIMARPLNVKGISAVTAKLEVRFRHAALIGEKLIVRGEMVNNRGRLYEMKAQLSRENGEVIAEANGTFMKVKK
jgi:acyl-CoA thioesterase FadM